MQHQRVGLGALQNRIGLAAPRIGAQSIGKRKLIRGVEMLLVLSWIASGLSKAIIQRDAPRACDMRHDAIKDPTALGVLIPAAIHELAQKAATLGTSPGIGTGY